MDSTQLAKAAQTEIPFLNWIGTIDGDGRMGSGLPYAAATVGTELGAATINLIAPNGRYVAELVQTVGTTQSGRQLSLILQCANEDSPRRAFDGLLETAKAASSLLEGLEVAEKAWEKSDAGRMHTLGLVVPNEPISLVK